MKRCKTRSVNDGRILELPLHLLFDILARLTIDTIFSCKCVCRKFLGTLIDPYFIELHLTKAANTGNGLIILDRTTISNLLLVYDNRLELGKPDSTNYDYSRPCQTMSVPTKVSQFYNKHVYMAGSCNGLFCIRYTTANVYCNTYYICNPILGEFLPLPPHIQYKLAEFVGFGFCPKTRQYKVLRFVTRSICTIYTLGSTDSWRRIGNAPFPRTVGSFDSSFKGNLHWITESTDMLNLICSFNLETDQFSYISPPVGFNQDALKKVMFLNPGSLGGLFCFMYNVGAKFEAFVMEDYSPEGHWTKKISVDLSTSNFGLQG